MVKQAPQYGSGKPGVDWLDVSTADHRVAPFKLGQLEGDVYPGDSVPLFRSDQDGEIDPSEFVTPLRKKRRASLASRILAGGGCAAAAVAILIAFFSSDAARNIIVNGKSSMAGAFPALSAAAQSDPSPLTAHDRQKDLAGSSATENQTPGVRNVRTAAVAPAREETGLAYQNTLQDRAPAAAAVTDIRTPITTPQDAVPHLDPDIVAALLKRADALIASGDVVAARLVLRRAADAGDARAAMTLAGTYDPVILDKLEVSAVVPDVAMARSWYEKAAKFGAAEAPQRLEMLASKRQ
jgi:hypothetical protein